MNEKTFLASPVRTQAVLERYNLTAKKKFGQNFLIDGNILSGIVEDSGITKDDVVLEIGPGIGTLTQFLAEAAHHVVCIEIDRDMIEVLEYTLEQFSNTTVIEGDVLKQDIASIKETYAADRDLHVIANLPYYITTPILMHLLESQAQVTSITVMMQKEVADRLTAAPGTKDYGAISLAVQYYAEPEVAFTVSPKCFIPAPKVESAVVVLKRHEKPPVEVNDPQFMFRLIHASFEQRRKTLMNGIANKGGLADKAKVEAALLEMGLDVRVRGETLSLAQFAQLSNILGVTGTGPLTH